MYPIRHDWDASKTLNRELRYYRSGGRQARGESKEEKKVHHKRFCKAVMHTDALNERFAYVEFPFQPYWSRKHQCYHVGRNNRIDTAAAIEFLRYSRARDKLRT